MQRSEQADEQRGPRPMPIGRRFLPGENGRKAALAAKQARIAARVSQWANGAALTSAELDLLRVAAELAITPQPKREEERTRRANTISRILQSCGLIDPAKRDGGRPGDVRRLFEPGGQE